jgi:hypothetical protein
MVLFEKSRWGLVFGSKIYFLIYFILKTPNKYHWNIKIIKKKNYFINPKTHKIK